MSDPINSEVANAPEVSKTSKLWMKDSNGYPSISVTMLAISFWVTTVAYIASMFSKIGPVEFKSFDSGACGAYFGLILGTYVARRATEAKWGNPNTIVTPYDPSVSPMPMPNPTMNQITNQMVQNDQTVAAAAVEEKD